MSYCDRTPVDLTSAPAGSKRNAHTLHHASRRPSRCSLLDGRCHRDLGRGAADLTHARSQADGHPDDAGASAETGDHPDDADASAEAGGHPDDADASAGDHAGRGRTRDACPGRCPDRDPTAR